VLSSVVPGSDDASEETNTDSWQVGLRLVVDRTGWEHSALILREGLDNFAGSLTGPRQGPGSGYQW